jgi:hypothetical protein
MSPSERLRRPVLWIALCLTTIAGACRVAPVKPADVEPTPSRSAPSESQREQVLPGAGEVRAGLDPEAPDVRYRAGESRSIGGWKLGTWERLPDENADGLSLASTGLGDLVQISRAGKESLLIREVSSIDPLSGSDINGDGQPEAVILTWSGGAHCCFGLQVYSLGDRARPILAPEPSNCDGRFEDLDGDGRLEYLSCDDAFAYAFCPFAFSPLPRVVLRYDAAQGAYVPATPDFAQAVDAGASAGLENPADPTLGPNADQGVDSTGDAASDDPSLSLCASLAPALDALYAGDTLGAWQRIDALGRAPHLPQDPGLRAAIEDILADSPYYLAPGELGRPVLWP